MTKGDICKINGCKQIVPWGNICRGHYMRKRRHGNYDYSPNWDFLKKGQLSLTNYGYYRVFINGKRILHHRYIMEQAIGRKLKKGERVHHLNGIKTDNKIENLKLLSQSQHIKKYHPKKSIINWSEYIIPSKAHRFYPSPIDFCLVKNCHKNTKYRGLCSKHYQSYYKYSHR